MTSPDSIGFGPETFTDTLSPSTRQFSWLVCPVDDPPDDMVATLNYVLADGSAPAATITTIDTAADGAEFSNFPGAYDVETDFCGWS